MLTADPPLAVVIRALGGTASPSLVPLEEESYGDRESDDSGLD